MPVKTSRKATIADYLAPMLGPRTKRPVIQEVGDMVFRGAGEPPPPESGFMDRAMWALGQPGVMPMGMAAFTPKGYPGLAKHAREAKDWREFLNRYIADLTHGRYFHVTDDPAFRLDPLKGGRDMSSMGSGSMRTGHLQVTSDPEYWYEFYRKQRPHIAEIDVSKVPSDMLKQVNRGFGNEFIPLPIDMLSVKSVRPAGSAIRSYNRYFKGLPQSEDKLRGFFDAAREGIE